MSFFEEEVAKAWRVTTSEPLIIRLHLSATMYLDSTNAPKLEVFQPSRLTKCGVASQMRVIMETFVNKQWKSLTNEGVKSKYTMVPPPTRTKHSATMSQIAESTQAAGTAEAPIVDDTALASLVDMGFSMATSRNALIINRGDVTAAANMLISSTNRCSENPYAFTDGSTCEAVKPAYSEERPALPTQNPPPLPCRAILSAPSHKPPPKGLMGFKPKFKKKPNNMSSSSTAPDLSAAVSVVSILSEPPIRRENVKVLPEFEHGFLVQVFEYARQRIPTLNEFCVVCDEQHIFKNGAMLKPAVCSRELCVFAYQTLGVMADAAEAIGTGPEVVDVLIEMARAACLSRRKDLIFDPYPTVVDPTNPNELALNPKTKDFHRVESALRGIFPMDTLAQIAPAETKKQMDLKNTLSYQLLQWIITSNRSHIVKLPTSRQLSFMNTDHQFLLLSSPPAKEALFRAEKHKYGSTFAFHGSNLENWHSILRNGLMNASGTKYQINGAAYGKGIYLSPKACVSFGYSGIYGVRRVITSPTQNKVTQGAKVPKPSRFLKGKNINCIALCEVITSKELKKSGDIWVCPNSNHVCTRFFFLYDDGQVGNANVDTQSFQVKQEVLKACGYQASYM